jgi:hypothetical protein
MFIDYSGALVKNATKHRCAHTIFTTICHQLTTTPRFVVHLALLPHPLPFPILSILSPSPSSLRFLRVTSNALQKQVCPDTLFDYDGEWFKEAFQSVLHNISVPIIRVWEDGEILAQETETGAKKGFAADHIVVADYDASGMQNNSDGSRDWRTYASQWRLRLTARFRDRFMREPSLARLIGNASYGEFEVEGTTSYFGRWSVMRNVMTSPSTGRKFAMNDVYVTRPEVGGTSRLQHTPHPHSTIAAPSPPLSFRLLSQEWDIGAGSWHGLDWLSMTLPSQISAGDTLFSPFVSPGWSYKEEKNCRPAQYLGLLKCMAAMGAEYFYNGFFSTQRPFPRSQNWAWVAVSV